MFLCLSPILSRIGYGFQWKDGVVVVWGALKGTGNLLLASCLHIQPTILGNFTEKVLSPFNLVWTAKKFSRGRLGARTFSIEKSLTRAIF